MNSAPCSAFPCRVPLGGVPLPPNWAFFLFKRELHPEVWSYQQTPMQHTCSRVVTQLLRIRSCPRSASYCHRVQRSGTKPRSATQASPAAELRDGHSSRCAVGTGPRPLKLGWSH